MEQEAALQKIFTPEFLGRLDKIVCFKPLTDSAMVAIARKYLQELVGRGKVIGIELQLPDEMAAHLKDLCTNRGGARQLRHLVQEKVEGPLAQFLLQKGREKHRIYGCIQDGNVQFHS